MEVNAVSSVEKPYKAELEYLRCDGNQYIDTGFKANTTTTDFDLNFVIEAVGLYDGVTGSGLFGSRMSPVAGSSSFNAFYANGMIRADYVVGTDNVNVSYNIGEDLHIQKNGLTSIINGIENQISDRNIEQSFNFYVGNFSNNSDSNIYTSGLVGQIKECKLWDNGVLVRDYVPVLDNNGVACLYDRVTKQCYYNEGSGEFEAGPITYVVPEPSPEPELEPTPVSLDSIDFQIGANSGENNMLNVDLGFSLNGFVGDVTTIESASDTLNAVDELKKTLNEKRSEIGVSRNRIDGIIESQSIKIENLSASHSTIVDTDFAQESATLVKSQILQQATSSLLKQANITQQLALQLLR